MCLMHLLRQEQILSVLWLPAFLCPYFSFVLTSVLSSTFRLLIRLSLAYVESKKYPKESGSPNVHPRKLHYYLFLCLWKCHMKDLSLGKKLLTSPLILVSNSQRIPCVDQHTELHGGVIIETLVPPSFSFARYDWGFLNCCHLVYKFNYTLISETSIFISKEKKKRWQEQGTEKESTAPKISINGRE